MAHPVVHFEIAAKDYDKISGFYRQLFGWAIDRNNPMDYGMVNTGSPDGIQGGIMAATGGMPGYLTMYVHVDDLEATLAAAGRLGAKTIVPPTPIPGMGAFAMFHDPEGNLIGLFKGGAA